MQKLSTIYMKTILTFILVAVCVTFFSCQKEEKLPVNLTSVTNSGILSGTIVDYEAGSVDSVKSLDSTILGRSGVSSSGYFTMELIIPPLLKMGVLSGVQVSDTMAMTGSFYINSFKGINATGELKKCNFATDTLNKPGMSYALFVYSDRAFTMNGMRNQTSTWGNKTYSYDNNYDLAINKGWNELIVKLISYNETTTSLRSSVILTNTITADLQWRNFKHSVSFAPKRKSSLKMDF